MNVSDTMESRKHLDRLSDQVASGSVVLFVGAGSSIAAGGPSASTLIERMRSRFGEAVTYATDFRDVCEDILDTPPFSRGDLEDFLADQFKNLIPKRSHRLLATLDWSAIFTTNFDDLIELTYRTSKNNPRDCVAIEDESPSVSVADRHTLYLFKMMGTIKKISPTHNTAVLTRADYNRAIIRRQNYFRVLSDFIKAGSILYLGYSFNDRIILELIDEVTREVGLERLPWSYACFPDFRDDEKTQYRFRRRRVIPLRMTMEALLDEISAKRQPVKTVQPTQTITIGSLHMPIEDPLYRHLSEYYEVLTDEVILQPTGGKDEFFRGRVSEFGPYTSNWDFIRHWYDHTGIGLRTEVGSELEKPVLPTVLELLQKRDIRDNRVLIFLGMPGIGKSTLLRRLAFDIYSRGDAPVVIVKSNRLSIDYKLLATFLEKLDEAAANSGAPSHKALVLFDEAAHSLRHIVRLKNYLSSRNRPVLIVGAARLNDWRTELARQSLNLPKSDQILIPERLIDDEWQSFVEHFHHLGYAPIKDDWFSMKLASETEYSFFAAVYRLVDPARRSLDEIIRQQYLNLSENAQHAFRVVSLFHQYDIGVNLELLVRSVGVSYESFYEELNRELAYVLFQESDLNNNIIIRTHHRIIAKKTVEFFFADPAQQSIYIAESMSVAVLENRKEREICESLLISRIGPNVTDSPFTSSQLRAMFAPLCSKYQVRAILHHAALVELNDGKYEDAERLLIRAVSAETDLNESYRGESSQNVLTTLGALYTRWGMQLLDQGQDDNAAIKFDQAEQSLVQAKHGDFVNAYAYHALAHLHYQLAQRTASETERINYLAAALETIQYGQDNTDSEEGAIFEELEQKIWLVYGKCGQALAIAERMVKQHHSPRGYFLVASWLARSGWTGQTDDQSAGDIEEAFRILEQTLELFPEDEYCLGLYCRLLRCHKPGLHAERLEKLKAWYNISDHDSVDLLYDLGRLSFVAGHYTDSRAYFKELSEGIGSSTRRRFRTGEPIKDSKNNVRMFSGKIVVVRSRTHGEVECNDLQDLPYNLRFSPRAASFNVSRGDQVKFKIAFTLLGPMAWDLFRR